MIRRLYQNIPALYPFQPFYIKHRHYLDLMDGFQIIFSISKLHFIACLTYTVSDFLYFPIGWSQTLFHRNPNVLMHEKLTLNNHVKNI